MRLRDVLLAALFCGGSASASPSSIGVFFAPDGSDCDLTAVPLMTFRTYVCAMLGTDAAGAGFVSAEFRLDGLDPQWFNTVIPNPAAHSAIGNPIGAGCNIAFPSCQTGAGTSGLVPLYTIESLPFGHVNAARLSVRRADSFCFGPGFVICCVRVFLCDAPVYTSICVQGGEALLNDGPCTVATPATTWGAVKHLYRG